MVIETTGKQRKKTPHHLGEHLHSKWTISRIVIGTQCLGQWLLAIHFWCLTFCPANSQPQKTEWLSSTQVQSWATSSPTPTSHLFSPPPHPSLIHTTQSTSIEKGRQKQFQLRAQEEINQLAIIVSHKTICQELL